MRSKFSIAGHPLHPLLVTVPVGLFVWTFIASLVFIARDERLWYDIAYWSGIAAVVSGLVAALPGFGDYFTMARRSDAAGIATTHMLLNLGVVALFAIAAFMMRDGEALTGDMRTTVVVMQGVGVALLTLSGWLGGEMVYRHHLSIIPDGETEAAETAHHARPDASARPQFR